jgi:hypothetical protein
MWNLVSARTCVVVTCKDRKTKEVTSVTKFPYETSICASHPDSDYAAIHILILEPTNIETDEFITILPA